MTLDRREFGRRSLAAAAMLGLGAAPAGAQPALPGNLVFRVLRNGTEIGTHRVSFSAAAGGRVMVQTRIELAMKLAFITAFRYRQEADELWQGDRVVWVKCRTDDDGDVTEVSGALNGSRFRLTGPAGIVTTRPDVFTSNSLWNARVVDHRALIDLQRGDEVDLAVRRVGEARVRAAAAEVTAEHYQIETARILADLWHDTTGRWVKAMFKIRGHTIEYVLAG